MTGDGLFHIDGGRLTAMQVTPYEAEGVLQELLANHPDLLAGGQMTPDAPRRWALVRREHGVPDAEGGATRWSVDHLFVDQDAVPTLVEVKRASDTRIRREVVGQMLDYAANGVRYWPAADLQAAFTATHGDDAGAVLRELTGDLEESVEAFFGRVAQHLRAGRLRMVFVADRVPDELRRIVEFLNEQLDPAEVFAVEVKQYAAASHPGIVVVPSVHGRTATVSGRDRSPRASRPMPSTLEEAFAAAPEETRRLVVPMVDLAADLGLQLRPSRGGGLLKTPAGATVAALYGNPWNSVEVSVQALRDHGHDVLADEVAASLAELTARKLAAKHPAVPVEDAFRHWERLRPLLERIAKAFLEQ